MTTAHKYPSQRSAARLLRYRLDRARRARASRVGARVRKDTAQGARR